MDIQCVMKIIKGALEEAKQAELSPWAVLEHYYLLNIGGKQLTAEDSRLYAAIVVTNAMRGTDTPDNIKTEMAIPFPGRLHQILRDGIKSALAVNYINFEDVRKASAEMDASKKKPFILFLLEEEIIQPGTDDFTKALALLKQS